MKVLEVPDSFMGVLFFCFLAPRSSASYARNESKLLGGVKYSFSKNHEFGTRKTFF